MLGALALGAVACSGDESANPSGGTSGGPSEQSDRPSAVEIPRDLDRAFNRLLDQRAAALLAGDRRAFGRGVAPGDEAFDAEQAAYFDNIAQLPVAELAFDLDPSSLVRSDDDYWGVVEVSLQLDGYDAEPVVTLDRYRFSRVGDRPGRHALSSVTDAEWEERTEVAAQPWDTGPIEVRSGVGVLGIFDAGSVDAARGLVRSVERGISDVSALVPHEWSRSVVVYALSDTDFLASIEDPPGGHPERLDGVAFTVEAGPSSDASAATRFVLHPRVLQRSRLERDRLVRHELTHVAIGARDDHAPVWLSEGIAEYVSVRPLAPQDRMVADAAVAAARGGQVTDLPADATFNDDDSAVHYGVAWWACEYLVATYGPASLWTILTELDTLGSSGDSGESTDAADARLEELIGINTRTLARKAAKLMLATYDSQAQTQTRAPTPTQTLASPGLATASDPPVVPGE